MTTLIAENNFQTITNNIVSASTTGEIEIQLVIAPISSIGVLTLGTETATPEDIFFHRKSGSSVFTYAVNRKTPQNHSIGTSVQMNDSAELFNFLSNNIYTTFYTYKISLDQVFVMGGKIHKDGAIIEVPSATLNIAEGFNYIYLTASNTIDVKTDEIGLIVGKISKSGSTITIEKYNVIWFGVNWAEWTPGNGIASITLLSKVWLVSTYRITYTDTTTSSFVISDGTPGTIATAPTGTTQIVADNNVPPSTSTTTYSDSEKWIKTTYANGSYLLALATGNTHLFGLAAGLYNYTADNQALSSRTQAGTYDTISHSITWAIPAEAPVGTVAEVTTPDGVTTVQAGNIAYVNKPNVFTRSIVFQWDTAFIGRTAFPYNDMWNVSGTVTFDQKNGMQQKMTLTGNTVLNFTNMTSSAGIIEVVGNGTATFTLANPINNGEIIKTGIVWASYTNGTALTAYPHFFSIVCDNKVHITYSGRSEDV